MARVGYPRFGTHDGPYPRRRHREAPLRLGRYLLAPQQTQAEAQETSVSLMPHPLDFCPLQA